jgi:hypothetical protein
MTIEREHKRVKAGEALQDFRKQIQNAFSTLDAVRANLMAMKTSLAGDADFRSEDTARIDAAIAFIDNKHTP